MSFFTSPRPRFRYSAVRQQSLAVARDVITGRVKKGNDVAELESQFCDLLNVQHAVATPQARIAIYLAVAALTAGSKKKVILSPYTIHDVINMVICAGGQPVFADIEDGTCNISADDVEALIDDETAVVLVTHLHGLVCDVKRISALCQQHGAALIEDCAQALGARVDGQLVGTFGEVGVYSFGRAKNINALFGGMLVTNDSDLAQTVRDRQADWPYFRTRQLLKQSVLCLTTNTLFSPPLFPVVLSRLLRYSHMSALDPFNKIVRGERNPTRRPEVPAEMLIRMTPMQARLVKQQLPDVDRKSDLRMQYAKVYHEGLADIPEVTIPPLRDDRSHIYLTFPIQVPDREALLTHLLRSSRDIARQYLSNNAMADAFSDFRRECPRTGQIAVSTLLLPTYPDYGMREVKRNVAAIRKFYGHPEHGPIPVHDGAIEQDAETEELLAEGAVLMHYILGRVPEQKLLDLYVYALRATAGEPIPLRVPRIVKRFPRLLRLLEPIGRSAMFKDRLTTASTIADVGDAPRFYNFQGKGAFRCMAGLAGVGLLEAVLFPFRIVGGTLWRW